MKKLLAMLLAALMLLGACAAMAETTEADEPITFGFTVTTNNNPFFAEIEAAVREVIEANGDVLITSDPQSDLQTQISQCEDMIAQGIDCLLLCPIDSAAIKPILTLCEEQNIPVVNFDTDVVDVDMVDALVATDNYSAGVAVGEDMLKKLPEGSKIAIMDIPSNVASDARLNGLLDTLGDHVVVVDRLNGKGDTGVTLPIAEDLIIANPDLAAFFGMNDPMAIGCVQAVASQGKTGEILVWGVDGSPEAKQCVAEGTMEGTGAQSPATIGKVTIETAYKLLEGETFDEKIYIESFIINSDNIDEYSLDGWQ